MKRFIVDIGILVVLLVVFGGAWYLAHRAPAEESGNGPVATVSYLCSGGKTITASYYTGASTPAATPDQPPTPGGSVSLTFADGTTMSLPQTISASGIRYANPDESVIFWSKGNGAFMTENGATTYADCVQQ